MTSSNIVSPIKPFHLYFNEPISIFKYCKIWHCIEFKMSGRLFEPTHIGFFGRRGQTSALFLTILPCFVKQLGSVPIKGFCLDL